MMRQGLNKIPLTALIQGQLKALADKVCVCVSGCVCVCGLFCTYILDMLCKLVSPPVHYKLLQVDAFSQKVAVFHLALPIREIG